MDLINCTGVRARATAFYGFTKRVTSYGLKFIVPSAKVVRGLGCDKGRSIATTSPSDSVSIDGGGDRQLAWGPHLRRILRHRPCDWPFLPVFSAGVRLP